MWSDILSWEVSNHVGDLASIAGVMISVVGFIATLRNVVSSRAAAERAELAAKAARDSIKLFDVAVDFSSAISILDEIKRLHRIHQWASLPERYSAVRKILITIKVSQPDLSDYQKDTIQKALTNVSGLEQAVEKAMVAGSQLNMQKLNAMISKNADQLHEIFVELRSTKVGV